jgi:hypothetical protein
MTQFHNAIDQERHADYARRKEKSHDEQCDAKPYRITTLRVLAVMKQMTDMAKFVQIHWYPSSHRRSHTSKV